MKNKSSNRGFESTQLYNEYMRNRLKDPVKYAKQLAVNKAWRDKNPGYSNEYRKRRPSEMKLVSRRQLVKRKYGITLEEAELRRLEQSNCCAICGIDFNTIKQHDIDHCHSTGKARGILCNPCNRGIGTFKDNIELMEKAIMYLKLHKQQVEV